MVTSPEGANVQRKHPVAVQPKGSLLDGPNSDAVDAKPLAAWHMELLDSAGVRYARHKQSIIEHDRH